AHARRIFTLWNQGGSIRQFFHHGDMVKWASPVNDISSTAAAPDALTTITIPAGIRTRPIVHTYHFQGTVGDTMYAYGDGDAASA
uniref:hypothetical protein n=1 Tax=Klebsiella aerogenes TaxID=548 RepID=UPI00195327E2